MTITIPLPELDEPDVELVAAAVNAVVRSLAASKLEPTAENWLQVINAFLKHPRTTEEARPVYRELFKKLLHAATSTIIVEMPAPERRGLCPECMRGDCTTKSHKCGQAS